MTTGNFSSATIGWTAIATGVAVILANVFVGLMYTVNIAFGTVNDVFNAVIGILSAVLAWMLYADFHARSPWMSQIALLLAVVGAILTIIGSVLIIYGFTGFVLAAWYTEVGDALIGLWLAAFCYSMQRGDTLPHNIIIFGLVVGAFMALGLLAITGILAGVDSWQSLPWYLGVGSLGFFGTYLLYPIWTIWFGRIVIKGI